MEAIFHLLGIAAGQRWHGGPRAEAGAETTAGGVFLLFCSHAGLLTGTCVISTECDIQRHRSS